MASIPVNDSLRYAAQKLMDHHGLVVLGNRVKGFLDNMAAKGIHRQAEGVSTNGLSNLDDLLGSSVLEATLNQEVSEAVDHQRMGLKDNGIHNLILLVGRTDLKLLLEKDGGLLIVVANNLVNNVLPVAVDIAIEQAAIVQGLCCWQIGRAFRGYGLKGDLSQHCTFCLSMAAPYL